MVTTVILMAALSLVTTVFLSAWRTAFREAQEAPTSPQKPAVDPRSPLPLQVAIGAFTSFFDTVGISSFGTATAFFRINRMMDNQFIPGTLNVGFTLPTIVQAIVLTTIMDIDPLTIFTMTAASAAGAWLGAGLVAGLSKRAVQIGLGIMMLATAGLMFLTQRGLFAAGGDDIGLHGKLLFLGLVGNFALGAFMTLGLRPFGPCLILLSLLGMNTVAAIPIMLSSSAFAIPVAGLRFIREKNYSLRAAAGLSLGGVPAVLLAVYIGRNLPLTALRWAIIAVVLWAALTMIVSASLAEPQSRVRK